MLQRLLILCLVLLLPARAAEARLRIGTLDVAPYGFLNNHQQADGAFYQLGNRIAELAGLHYSNQLLPTARLYALLQRRRLDLAITSRSLEQEMQLVRLGKVWRFEGVILHHPQLGLQPRNLSDFKPYLIGRLNDSCPKLSREGYRVYELSDYGQGLRMLLARRLDALCGESGSLGLAMRASGIDPALLAPPFVFLTADVNLYANPDLPASIRDRLSASLVTLSKSGEIQYIIERYLDKPDVSPASRSQTQP